MEDAALGRHGPSLVDLPNEIILMITAYLSEKAYSSLSSTCKRFYGSLHQEILMLNARRDSSALCYACQHGLVNVAKEMLDLGVSSSIEFSDMASRSAVFGLPGHWTALTPLTVAVAYRQADMVGLLIDHGANVNPTVDSEYGNGMTPSPINLAAASTPLEGSYVDDLETSCRRRSVIIETLLDGGADINYHHPVGNRESLEFTALTPLNKAVADAHTDAAVLDTLLKYGAMVGETEVQVGDVTSIDRDALYYHFQRDATDWITNKESNGWQKLRLLLQHGAAAVSSKHGPPSIHLCIQLLPQLSWLPSAYQDFVCLVSTMLDHGADINMMDVSRGSPITALCQCLVKSQDTSIFPDLLQFFLEHGADPDGGRGKVSPDFGPIINTPALEICSQNRNRDIQAAMLKVLLAYGPDVRLADIHGLTPLHHAVRNRHSDLVRLLLDAELRPNINCRSQDNHTPLYTVFHSKMSGHFQRSPDPFDEESATIFRLLVEHGADVRAGHPVPLSDGIETPLSRLSSICAQDGRRASRVQEMTVAMRTKKWLDERLEKGKGPIVNRGDSPKLGKFAFELMEDEGICLFGLSESSDGPSYDTLMTD